MRSGLLLVPRRARWKTVAERRRHKCKMQARNGNQHSLLRQPLLPMWIRRKSGAFAKVLLLVHSMLKDRRLVATCEFYASLVDFFFFCYRLRSLSAKYAHMPHNQ